MLDEDMDQYIHDNTDDEISHAAFINAYLASKGAEPVNLDQFRTLPSSQATGAQQIGRLTNLMQLTVDTSFWTRYRSDSLNPDFGDTLPQAIPDFSWSGSIPAIPRTDADHSRFRSPTSDRQHGRLPLRVGRARWYEPLRLAGAAGHPHGGVANPAQHRRQRDYALPDLARQSRQCASPDRPHERSGLSRPQRRRRTDFQTNLIMPEPTIFLDRKFPICSIIRPTETDGAAMAALNALTADGLFIGQTPEFFALLSELAQAADAAGHGGPDDDENDSMEATAARNAYFDGQQRQRKRTP